MQTPKNSVIRAFYIPLLFLLICPRIYYFCFPTFTIVTPTLVDQFRGVTFQCLTIEIVHLREFSTLMALKRVELGDIHGPFRYPPQLMWDFTRSL